jgi:hypothetical protein
VHVVLYTFVILGSYSRRCIGISCDKTFLCYMVGECRKLVSVHKLIEPSGRRLEQESTATERKVRETAWEAKLVKERVS